MCYYKDGGANMVKIELDKRPVTMKLSLEARELIVALGQKNGMKGTAVVEQSIREKAQRDLVQRDQ
jgi:hypothetical protein